MKKTRGFRIQGFTIIQLMVSLVAVAIIAIAAGKSIQLFTRDSGMEALKIQAQTKDRLLQTFLKKDFYRSPMIDGYTSQTTFFEKDAANRKIPYVSRFRDPYETPPAATDIDNINFWAEKFGDIDLSVRVICTVAGGNCTEISAYYQLRNPTTPTAEDNFAINAFKTNAHFFLSNEKATNLVRRKGIVAAAAGCPAVPAFPVGSKCLRMEFYRSPNEFQATAGAGAMTYINYKDEYLDIPTHLKLAELVTYQVDPTSNVLERITYRINPTSQFLDRSSSGDPMRIAENVQALTIGYRFSEGPTNNRFVYKNSSGEIVPIRHPKDPAYISAQQAQGKEAVRWEDVTQISAEITYDAGPAPSQLVDRTGGNFRVDNHRLLMDSVFTSAVASAEQTDSQIIGDTISPSEIPAPPVTGSCDPTKLKQNRCRPECAYLYDGAAGTDKDPIYAQHVFASTVSDFCRCATTIKDGKILRVFYNISDTADNINLKASGEAESDYPERSDNSEYARERLRACMNYSKCDTRRVRYLYVEIYERRTCMDHSHRAQCNSNHVAILQDPKCDKYAGADNYDIRKSDNSARSCRMLDEPPCDDPDDRGTGTNPGEDVGGSTGGSAGTGQGGGY